MDVLALVDAPDHVCCRYRVRAFEPALNRAGWSLGLVALRRGALGRRLQLARLPRGAAVLLQRKLLSSGHLKVLRQRAGRLIFDFDDAIFDRDSYDPRGPDCPRRARRFAATVRAADVVIAGNDYLADRALRAGARPECVRVIPTCVDLERYQPAGEDELAARPRDRLDLVWIGSSSTLQGLEQCRSLWERLARAVPGVRLRVICDRVPDLGLLPVRGIPWSAATEARELAAGDVGVTWVPDDHWSLGKCGLKVLQYQAAGLPVLANPVGVHAEMIEPGVSGELPTTDEEWITVVRTMADDPPQRWRMGRAGRASVATNYSVAAWKETFVAALTGASEGGATSPRPPSAVIGVGGNAAPARRAPNFGKPIGRGPDRDRVPVGGDGPGGLGGTCG